MCGKIGYSPQIPQLEMTQMSQICIITCSRSNQIVQMATDIIVPSNAYMSQQIDILA